MISLRFEIRDREAETAHFTAVLITCCRGGRTHSEICTGEWRQLSRALGQQRYEIQGEGRADHRAGAELFLYYSVNNDAEVGVEEEDRVEEVEVEQLLQHERRGDLGVYVSFFRKRVTVLIREVARGEKEEENEGRVAAAERGESASGRLTYISHRLGPHIGAVRVDVVGSVLLAQEVLLFILVFKFLVVGHSLLVRLREKIKCRIPT